MKKIKIFPFVPNVSIDVNAKQMLKNAKIIILTIIFLNRNFIDVKNARIKFSSDLTNTTG